MTILDTTPAGTQAQILEAVARSKYPRGDIPTIAASYSLTIGSINAILNSHGYPDTQRMLAAATTLRAQAAAPAPEADAGEAGAKPALVSVPVADLVADSENLREKVAAPTRDAENSCGRDMPVDDIEQLADSINAVGLLQPIVVRRDEGRYVVVAGHRRLAAIKRLRWTHVDVIVRAPMRPDEVIAAMLIENGQRRDLDPIEEARGIKRLQVIHKLTDQGVARKIGRTQSYVSGRLALLDITPEQQAEIRAGVMGITAGTQLGRQQAGKVRKGAKGNATIHHFGETNELARLAKARCRRLKHSSRLAGGVACGECWESVIRADERQHAQTLNATAADCVTCGHALGGA